MKILIVASLGGSLLNFRGPLLLALQAKGHDIHVAAPSFSLNDKNLLEANGFYVHEIYMDRTGVNPITDLFCFFSLFFLMRSVRPDVVLGYTVKPVIYGTLAAWLVEVPRRFALITGLGYAFTGNATGFRALVRVVMQCLYRFALLKSTKVLFQNLDDEYLFRCGGLISDSVPSSVVNGSGVDIQHFDVVPLPDYPICFLLIARFLGDKGIREYAEAAKRVKKRYPETIFLLAGWIDSNPDAISKNELDGWINEGIFINLGRLDDVRQAIADCSVYVLPSYREGMPRTILEAMSMGRPIITTDAPGCRETVRNGYNGVLVQIKSVDELERAMVRFIEEPTIVKTMGARSRSLVVLKYDVNKINATMIAEMDL